MAADASASTPIQLAPLKSDDLAWEHARVVPGKRNHTICVHCNKHIKGGGITRLKHHLAGIQGQVLPCKKVSTNIRFKFKTMLDDFQQDKQRKDRVNRDIGRGPSFDEDEDDEDVMQISPPRVPDATKKRRVISNHFAPRTTPGAQPSIKSAMASKEQVHQARMAVSRWWYDAGILFNAANSLYYQPAIDAMTAIGPRFVGPTAYDLRCPLLKSHIHEIRDYLFDIKASWGTSGCSIMSDGWTNRRQVPFINFLAYSPLGTMFIKSVDTSCLRKDADTLFKIFDEVVQYIGPSNVVQFITDNEAAYKGAGKRLARKYGTFFWSPCAAHCIDLMLENYAKPDYFPVIRATIEKAKRVTRFIYNHSWVVNTMKKDFTKGRELCRAGVTRFATNFLTLACFMKFRNELRQMFTSETWVNSRYAKDKVGKEVAKIVLEDSDFWYQCSIIVSVSEPLVRVLRMVDGDEKPSMGYLYEAMDKAKQAIMTRLKHKITMYLPFTRVIDARWDKQLHSHLHAAGCFLNPGIYFGHSFMKQDEVQRGFVTCVTSLIDDDSLQSKISKQIPQYTKSLGFFGNSLAIRQQAELNPVEWWEQFGFDTPELKKFAVRILSQCCSSSGCERNWSTFEFIQTKKRNRLEFKRLNDLVYVRYNLKLRERLMKRGKSTLDPISLDNIDLLDEWVCEEPAFFTPEDLQEDISWEDIEPTMEALNLVDEEPELPDLIDGDDFQFETQNGLAGQDFIGSEKDPFIYVPLEDN